MSLLVRHPVTSLDHFLDGDVIDGADLVLWPTVGVIHVPVSEDVPVVGNFETGFVLRPSNLHDELAAMDVMKSKVDYKQCAPQKPDFAYPAAAAVAAASSGGARREHA